MRSAISLGVLVLGASLAFRRPHMETVGTRARHSSRTPGTRAAVEMVTTGAAFMLVAVAHIRES